jgi:hypothetical protein
LSRHCPVGGASCQSSFISSGATWRPPSAIKLDRLKKSLRSRARAIKKDGLKRSRTRESLDEKKCGKNQQQQQTAAADTSACRNL